jgi:hypothetical protein
MRIKRVAATLFAAVLGMHGSALAHHSLHGVYSGPVAGGGQIVFRVQDFWNVDSYTLSGDVTTSCGGSIDGAYGLGTWPIVNHGFDTGEIQGTFDASQHATGTITFHYADGCVSDPIAWTATTDAPPATQCTDGVDNDGDGKIDAPDATPVPGNEDPGCSDVDDNDETDPGRPPGTKLDTTPPVASQLTVTRDGHRISLELSEPASVRFTIQRAGPAGFVSIASFTRHGHTGRNRFSWNSRRRLSPGRYRLIAVSTDLSANTGRPVRTRFRV